MSRKTVINRLVLQHDTHYCIGCSACEVQCKTNKALQPGTSLCRIIRLSDNEHFFQDADEFVFMPCFHCTEAACQTVCPTGAIKKRPQDGIVYIEASLCIGCKSCITACQWGACQWNEVTQKAVKCDLCMDRLAQDKQPACVTVCPTQCLTIETAVVEGSIEQGPISVFQTEGETAS